MAKRVLVAFFSASGVTRRAAENIAKATGGDLYEIVPETPYSARDLDWTDKNSRSTVEMNDPDCRPAIASPLPDTAAYDIVFVGFPVWWYVEPRVIDTFLRD